jgi:hypothetical protein
MLAVLAVLALLAGGRAVLALLAGGRAVLALLAVLASGMRQVGDHRARTRLARIRMTLGLNIASTPAGRSAGPTSGAR